MRTRFAILTLGICALAALSGAAQSQEAELQFEAARQKAVIDGDHDAAVADFEALATRYRTTEPAVAAKALLALAEAYDSVADGSAAAVYTRLVSEFPARAEARTARVRLAVREQTGDGSGAGSRLVWQPEGTALPALLQYGRVSKDGRLLPFTAFGAEGGLFLRDLATGETRHLVRQTPSVAFADYGPVLSPDARYIAYHWRLPQEFRSELHVVETRTGSSSQPRVLLSSQETPRIYPHDWSADGRWIAVELRRRDGVGQVALVSAQTGDVRVVHTIDWRARPQSVQFSPDGRYLAFDLVAPDSANRDITVLTVDEPVRQVAAVVHRANDSLIGWSPDGRELFFESDRTGTRSTWVIRLDDGAVGAPRLVRQDLGKVEPRGVTASGSLFYLTEVPVLPAMMTADVDLSSGRTVELPRPADDSDGTFPVWSNSGQWLAYNSSSPEFSGDTVLVVRSADGTTVRTFPMGLEGFIHPRWSPDDRRVVVKGYDFDGSIGVFAIDVSDGEATLVARGREYDDTFMIGWSPDGRRIFFGRQVQGRERPDDAPTFAVIEYDTASGAEREVQRMNLGTRPDTTRLTMSPDGTRVYHSRLHPGGQVVGGLVGSLVELDLTTGTERILTDGIFPMWRLSPDGTHAVVGRPGTPESSLWVVPIDGSAPRELLRGLPARLAASFSSLEWAPDGGSIIAALGTGQVPDVWWVPTDDRSPRRLELGLQAGDYVLMLDVHPDGRLVFVNRNNADSGGRTAKLWELTGFARPSAPAGR